MILFGLFGNLYWPASDALATSFLPPTRAGEVFAPLRVANATGIGADGLRRYGVTFALAGLVWGLSYALFALSPWFSALALLAMIVYTLAELLFMPASGAIIVELAPERLRGRYLAFSSVVWGLSWGSSSWAAGQVLESSRPILLWPGLIALLLVGAAVSLLLDRRPQRQAATPAAEESVAVGRD